MFHINDHKVKAHCIHNTLHHTDKYRVALKRLRENVGIGELAMQYRPLSIHKYSFFLFTSSYIKREVNIVQLLLMIFITID